ncbi:DNA oxidative demethylase AlkB [Leucothrix pacifica]|uniref:DNA oxidative demethylase AlkB n=1 Tax=Leucothrix pacifica TaxID=1247513 RepID=A0A317C1E1_9GAMM|nr:DNA oxidative demethylase AlkB [Leucothrix pacifica]PWQ92189.1 DNA oxidative demethylase AlkB [Leucothrix pacifica]
MNYDLFDLSNNGDTWTEEICKDALVLRQFAVAQAPELMQAVTEVTTQAPFRHMQTPGGYTMSASLSSCGSMGWVSDRVGYRYSSHDPQSKQPWPAMPEILSKLATEAAEAAGYHRFYPDACLINRYTPGAKMSLHQDRNERDYDAPIVSVSLGVPATFLFGGMQRGDKTIKVPLAHGDVVVWGGESRLKFHGILPIKAGYHSLTGEDRINITFRVAG